MKQAVKNLFFETIVEAVIVKSIAALPFLGLPVIRQLYAMMVKKLFDTFYTEIETIVEFKIIDARTSRELRDYNNAADAIAMAVENENTTPEELERLRNEYKNNLRNLINMRPS